MVAILTERVSDEYLEALRAVGVSYITAGNREVDLAVALENIGARFDVATLMLEGGGSINGSMPRAGLVDEVSVLVAPVADGRIGAPSRFDVHGDAAPRVLALDEVKRLDRDVLWLRYLVEDPD